MTGDMDTRFMQYLKINRELRGVHNQAFNDGSLLDYVLVDEDPTPEGIIQDYQEGRPIRIYTGFSAGSIWGTESNNYLFRALHDSFHLKNGYPFTLEGEIRVANSLKAYADLHGFKLFGWLQYLDTVLPAIYYEINGEFPSQEYIKNQIKEYMKEE